MKKKFDFDLGLQDDDVDLDADLDAKIGGVELSSGQKPKRTEDVKGSMVAQEHAYGSRQTSQIKTDEPPKLSSAQQATFRLKELNSMELNINPAGGDAEDCEIYGGEYPEVDIDQQNEQAMLSAQQAHHSKVSTNPVLLGNEIVSESNNFQSSVNKFAQISDQEIEQRNAFKRSRQSVIAGRLLAIRGEMKMLEAQLKNNEQQQSGSSNDITSLESLKGRLEGVCRMQGFQDILLQRQDLAKAFNRQTPVSEEELKVAANKLDLNAIVTKLHLEKNKTGEATETSIDLVFDRSKKEMGTLMKLNSLQKRIHFIKHVLGGWKPNPRAKTLTDQVVQVQKLLELLDAQKISHYQRRLELLLDELDAVSGKNQMSVDQRREQLGHPKELIEKLHTACLSVKLSLENLPKLVERMEQKRKLHEMCASVMLDTTTLVAQQDLLLARFRENKELLDEVSTGMADNLRLAKENIEYLKKTTAVPAPAK